MGFERSLLSVEASVLGKPWRDRLDAAGAARAMTIAQHTGLSDLLSRVLAGRGVGPEAALQYLDPTLRALLPEPFSLTAMEEATDRLCRAVTNARNHRHFRRLRRRRRLLLGAARANFSTIAARPG